MTHLCSLLFGKDRSKFAAGVVGVIVAVKVMRFISRAVKQRKQATMIANLEKDVVHLFSFPRWARGPHFSTPCFRVECFLRLARIPYKIHFTMDPSSSPTERLPYIVYNDTVLADSEFIVQWLIKKFDVQANRHLSAQEDAIGLAARRLVEGSLQLGVQRMSMVDNSNHIVDIYRGEIGVPRFVAAYFVRQMRKGYINLLNVVGHGDLTDEQYKSEMLRDVKALEALIGAKPFLLGNKPTTYDCNVYACLQMSLAYGIQTPEFDYLSNSTTLRGYLERMGQSLFPDMDAIIARRKDATQTFRLSSS
jgi:glutathione S-transferase